MNLIRIPFSKLTEYIEKVRSNHIWNTVVVRIQAEYPQLRSITFNITRTLEYDDEGGYSANLEVEYVGAVDLYKNACDVTYSTELNSTVSLENSSWYETFDFSDEDLRCFPNVIYNDEEYELTFVLEDYKPQISFETVSIFLLSEEVATLESMTR